MEENRSIKGAALLLPLRSIAFLLIYVIGAALVNKKVSEISSWWSVAASAVNIVTILIIVLLAKRSGMSYRQVIRFEKGKNTPKKVTALVFGFMMIGMAGMYLAGLVCFGTIMPKASVTIATPMPLALAVINLIVLPATISFAEDGLYLGLGVNSIGNKTAAILIPAFFYALQHCFIPTLFDAKYILYRFLSFLPLTLVFCAYYRKKQDPLPIMIAHAFLDLATSSLILLTSASPAMYEKMSSM